MKMFKLTLAERILLRPVVVDNWFDGNLEQQHRAWEILQIIDYTDEERNLIPNEGVIVLTQLPENYRTVLLEDRDYEFLNLLIRTFRGWLGPSQILFSMEKAIKEAEEVKPTDINK